MMIDLEKFKAIIKKPILKDESDSTPVEALKIFMPEMKNVVNRFDPSDMNAVEDLSVYSNALGYLLEQESVKSALNDDGHELLAETKSVGHNLLNFLNNQSKTNSPDKNADKYRQLGAKYGAKMSFFATKTTEAAVLGVLGFAIGFGVCATALSVVAIPISVSAIVGGGGLLAATAALVLASGSILGGGILAAGVTKSQFGIFTSDVKKHVDQIIDDASKKIDDKSKREEITDEAGTVAGKIYTVTSKGANIGADMVEKIAKYTTEGMTGIRSVKKNVIKNIGKHVASLLASRAKQKMTKDLY